MKIETHLILCYEKAEKKFFFIIYIQKKQKNKKTFKALLIFIIIFLSAFYVFKNLLECFAFYFTILLIFYLLKLFRMLKVHSNDHKCSAAAFNLSLKIFLLSAYPKIENKIWGKLISSTQCEEKIVNKISLTIQSNIY